MVKKNVWTKFKAEKSSAKFVKCLKNIRINTSSNLREIISKIQFFGISRKIFVFFEIVISFHRKKCAKIMKNSNNCNWDNFCCPKVSSQFWMPKQFFFVTKKCENLWPFLRLFILICCQTKKKRTHDSENSLSQQRKISLNVSTQNMS